MNMDHESELWSITITQLVDGSHAVTDRYRRANLQLHPDGPTGAGYFLGYRISEADIAKHDQHALSDLFRITARPFLNESGYAPHTP